MRFCFVSAVLGALAIPALALTLPSTSNINHVVHEKRDTIQKKWIQSNDLDRDHILPARIGLKQSNLHLGMDYLMEM
jgi:tripeptidyl-peptidase-1